MITKNDLNIENISYTNKDFPQIYPELIDLTKKLTDKWDPENTNESDPGLVLLKLVAFMADKTNYNIDKNILERFIPSATQENSVRSLYDMLGYNMKYYNSATSNIYFKYIGESEDLKNGFKLKAFDTSFKTSENIVYTLLEDIVIGGSNKSDSEKLAIQGELTCLNVSKSSSDITDKLKIQLNNLDDNNRVYFPDKYVAQNGVFINKEYYDIMHTDAWRRVDNLNDIDLGEKVYKFAFDSTKNLPYIEFPEDISDLIGDGLEIWYIITDGISGYASNGSLTQLNKYSIVSLTDSPINAGSFDSSQYIISNTASIGAKDPESLNEAYTNFKKTIGTFNTLVSKRDYSNAIYTAINGEDKHFVSADHVEDGNSDINHTTTLLTRDNTGENYYTYIKDNTTSNDVLRVYATKPVFGTILSDTKYDYSYSLINQADLRNIDEALSNYKTITHSFKLPEDNDVSLIENRYKLNINISTKYKINELEQEEVRSNIKKALYNNFNARNIDFGEEIPYELIVEVIENADSRIKAVFVDEPEITPYIVLSNNRDPKLYKDENIINLELDDTLNCKIISKNIAAGRFPYMLDKSVFSYDFNQSSYYPTNLKSIDSYFNLTLSPEGNYVGNNKGKLQENESIQILEDSYITTATYPAYVYYYFDSKNIIPPDTCYKLQNKEVLYIYYTDPSDVKQFKKYTAGTVIRPQGFTLKKEAQDTASKYGDFISKEIYASKENANAIPLYSLGLKESIEIVKRNEKVLNNDNQKLFWILNPTENNENGKIFNFPYTLNSKKYYILEENEYLIYPNDNATSIVVLGSGTKIFYNGGTLEKHNDKIVLEENLNKILETEDIGIFNSLFDWEIYDLSNIKNNITCVETAISTFIEGDKIETNISNLNSSKSNWVEFKTNNYFLEVETNNRIVYDNISNKLIRKLLTISGNKYIPQKLKLNQHVDLVSTSGTTTNLDSKYEFQLNPWIDGYKNTFLGVVQYKLEGDGYVPKRDESGKIIYSYPYSCFHYTLIDPDTNSFLQFLNNYANSNLSERNEYVIPYDQLSGIQLLTVQIPSNSSISLFTGHDQKTIILKYTDEYPKLKLEAHLKPENRNKGYAYYISKPKMLEINKQITDLDKDGTLVSKIQEFLENTEASVKGSFDYTAPLNISKIIEANNPFSASWFFDKNNIYNSYTISKIDFENSIFKIVGSSKK